MTSPIPLHPGPASGFDEPFEMLRACHQRVERMLGLLGRLDTHLDDAGADAAARQAARDVMRYFDLAGPAHHEDEERHVLPALRDGGDEGLAALARRLHAEHGQMAARWTTVRALLQAVADGEVPPADRRREAWTAFAALYRAHIDAEERFAYPPVEAACDAARRAAAGAEMARRRGIDAGVPAAGTPASRS